MKKLYLFSIALLMLAACSDSDSATPETKNSNVTSDANVENVTTKPATPTENTIQTDLLKMVDAMEGWASFQTVFSFVETYKEGDYPAPEFHVDKQYVAEPAQVNMFSSIIGFTGSTIEQYASYEYADGGFESMDGGEFYDMDPETVDIILKNALPSRAELLRVVLNNATDMTENNGTFSIDLDSAVLADLFEQLQATFLYNAKSSELDEETLDLLTTGTDTFHSGEASITTDGSSITTYSITFDVTSEIGGRNESTFTETFDRVNSIEEVEAPEELMMGIGVN